MKRLLIVGAGGFGREVLVWVEELYSGGDNFSVGGFLDQRPDALKGFGIELPVIDDPEYYEPQLSDIFVCAIGDPNDKLRLCESLSERGAQWLTVIHKSVIIGPRCEIGVGCVLCPGVVLTTDIKLCDFVSVNLQSTIGHDVRIGDGVTLSPHCDLAGGVRLERGVFLGSQAVVIPGVEVSEFARIGAGSVVVNKVEQRTTVFGVPAKCIHRQNSVFWEKA